MISIQYELRYGNKKFIFHGCNDDIISNYHITREQFYELNELEFLSGVIAKIAGNDLFQIIDAGANIGNHSLYFAHKFPKATIHSFEMNPVTFNLLQKTVVLNNCANIHVYNIGLHEKESRCGVIMPKGNRLGGARLDMSDSCLGGGVRIAPLDSIIPQAMDASNPVKFMKIDVEGSETALIKGATKTIEKYMPAIFCEIHEPDNFEQIKKMLVPLSYIFINFQKFISPNFLLMPLGLVKKVFDYDSLLEIIKTNSEKTMLTWDKIRKLKK